MAIKNNYIRKSQVTKISTHFRFIVWKFRHLASFSDYLSLYSMFLEYFRAFSSSKFENLTFLYFLHVTSVYTYRLTKKIYNFYTCLDKVPQETKHVDILEFLPIRWMGLTMTFSLILILDPLIKCQILLQVIVKSIIL